LILSQCSQEFSIRFDRILSSKDIYKKERHLKEVGGKKKEKHLKEGAWDFSKFI